MTIEARPSTEIPALATYLKALAEPSRLRIFDLLMQGVQCNCELGDALQMAPNLISHHLSILRRAGLIVAERDPVDARWIYYSVDRDALDALVTSFGSFFDPARIQTRRPNCGPGATLTDA